MIQGPRFLQLHARQPSAPPAQLTPKCGNRVGIEHIGSGLEFKEEERERIARLVFNDFLVKLLQGRLGLFDVF